MDPGSLVSNVQTGSSAVMMWRTVLNWHSLGLMPVKHRLNASVLLSIVVDYMQFTSGIFTRIVGNALQNFLGKQNLGLSCFNLG